MNAPTRADALATPSTGDRTQLRPKGSNHVGMRQFNERVVLQSIRLHGPLAKADLARLTHLSTQTIGLIIARLLEDGLVLKGEPQRGRVGQPSVPIALNPDGAYAVGIKIGRRSLDVLLVDFVGRTRARHTLDYAFPEPRTLFAEIGRRLVDLRRTLGPAAADRLTGVGIAAPLSLGGWQRLLGLPPAQVESWRNVDIQERVQGLTDLPVELVKDTTAACVAELVAGRGQSLPSFLYLFVDTFIGGGLVIDSHLHSGLHGNAGAVASLPLGPASPNETPAQLLSRASLFQLEQLYVGAGLDPRAMADERALQPPWQESTQRWLAEASRGIALAIVNSAALLDQEGVILDGNLGRPLLGALIASVEAALDECNWEGLFRPRLHAGTIGPDARAIGGALLPLYGNFAPDRDLFLKQGS